MYILLIIILNMTVKNYVTLINFNKWPCKTANCVVILPLELTDRARLRP